MKQEEKSTLPKEKILNAAGEVFAQKVNACTVYTNNFSAYFNNFFFLQRLKNAVYRTVFTPTIKFDVYHVPISVQHYLFS